MLKTILKMVFLINTPAAARVLSRGSLISYQKFVKPSRISLSILYLCPDEKKIRSPKFIVFLPGLGGYSPASGTLLSSLRAVRYYETLPPQIRAQQNRNQPQPPRF